MDRKALPPTRLPPIEGMRQNSLQILHPLVILVEIQSLSSIVFNRFNAELSRETKSGRIVMLVDFLHLQVSLNAQLMV